MEKDRKAILDILLGEDYDFVELAFLIFRFQYKHNKLYQEFCNYLGRKPSQVNELHDIPFLPIRFFKTHRVMTGDFNPQLVFRSSGTTDSGRSNHFIRDQNIYHTVATRIFQDRYGPLDNFTILALLPSYLEQGDSSLIHMIRLFILETYGETSSFYRYDFDRLSQDLEKMLHTSRNILLWGVTYALLDFAEHASSNLSKVISENSKLTVMETGGMKGYRAEMIRSEVHYMLNKQLKRRSIHSEYGMTEMLSQAYSKGDGVFDMGNTLRVLAYDVMDPLSFVGDHRNGRCHVIDLANVDSCSFIATDDLCRTAGEKFEIMGRADNTAVRGCNLLYFN